MSDLTVRPLSVRPLEAMAFRPFGAVIAPETADAPSLNRSPGNLGFLWVHKELEFPKAAYMCSLRYYYRGNRCEFLQKHPDSTVTLIPVSGVSAIVVAPDDASGGPDVDATQAFLLEPGRGAVIHRGVWLRYAYPLTPFADFAYVTQRVDPATANVSDDTVRANLDTDLGLVFDLVFDVPAGEGYAHTPSGALAAAPERNPPHG